MKEMNGMTPMTAIGPMIKPGMKAIGPMTYDDLYYLDEYGYFQKKGKGKGKGKKGKKGKDDEGKGGKPGDGKGKSNYVQPQTSSTPAIQNQQQQQQQQQQQAHYSSAASSSGHGFFALAETEPARVDAPAATYEEQEYHRRTRRGGQNQRDATAQFHRKEAKRFPVLVGRSSDQENQVLMQVGDHADKPQIRHFSRCPVSEHERQKKGQQILLTYSCHDKGEKWRHAKSRKANLYWLVQSGVDIKVQ